MPSYVIPDKCDGCKALDKTACQYICPNDLMVLNKDIMKAYNQDPQMCWECYSCVKICPTQAIEVRGYQDFVPMGASVTAMRGSEDIMWTVQREDGGWRWPDCDYAPMEIDDHFGVTLAALAVGIAPDDYAHDSVTGVLAGESDSRYIVVLDTPKCGTVHVHFPKEGYAVSW